MKVLCTFIICLFPVVCYAGDYGFNKVQQVVVEQKLVEFDADLYHGFNGYAVQEELQQSRVGKLEAKDELIKQLLDQNKQLIETLIKINANLSGNSGSPSPGSPSGPTPTPTPVPETPSDVGEVELLLVNKCVDCHSDGKYKYFENNQLIDSLKNPKTIEDQSIKEKIFERVHGGDMLREQNLSVMPKASPPLSDQEVTDIWLWTKGIKK